ncbi:MAG: glycosyltransferase family 87 protein [Candidatus Promineifilaceae bacterium]
MILAERNFNTNQLRRWRSHLAALFLFVLLSLPLTWPLIRDFRTAIPSDGLDARHHLWMLWHVKEALLGRQSFYDLNLLYYPEGVNLLTHSTGPVMAVLSLPFQWLGPEAAYNGSILVGLTLTGWFMYLLLRQMGFKAFTSFWGGTLYMLAPIILAGVYGHLAKVFLGLTPLALLCLMRMLKSRRWLLWAILTSFVFFLTLQHNGYQFVMTAVLLGLVGLLLLWQSAAGQRREVFKKLVITAGFSAVLLVPQLLLMNQLGQGPLYEVARSDQSTLFQPDLIEFFIPSGFQWFFGPAVLKLLDLTEQVETAVSISLIALLFLLFALLKNPRKAAPWILIGLIFFILSLGPSLKLLGERHFTLPYALLVRLPGLNFMRTPGRFMMVGHLAFIIAACYGLEALLRMRSPRWSSLAMVLLLGLTLLEGFPRPWPQETLPDPPAFYQMIAQDEEQYGVLDLPIRPTEFAWETAYSSYYQMLQMTHQKGIASGYISRVPQINPAFPCLYPTPVAAEPDFTVNGQSTSCFDNLETRLAENNFRYVVWHKPESWPYWGYTADSVGFLEAQTIVQQTFGDRPPDYEDEEVRVYSVRPGNTPLPTEMAPRKNWYQFEGNLRWAKSPAWIYITSPNEQEAALEMVLAMMFTPDGSYHVGSNGTFIVRMDNELLFQQVVNANEQISIPLHLTEGTHLVELELEAGNFQPTTYDPNTEDRRQLSFATQSINLHLEP